MFLWISYRSVDIFVNDYLSIKVFKQKLNEYSEILCGDWKSYIYVSSMLRCVKMKESFHASMKPVRNLSVKSV